jgi:crotonobetainyl-CoA:carnitine CoA-transferase CaiB-like acyl-CoA transferase
MGLPIQFSRTPSQFDQPAPELGTANEEVYRKLLHMSDAEIARLQSDGII